MLLVVSQKKQVNIIRNLKDKINNDYMKNCKCKKPKSDNYFRIGKYEGKYTKCLNCGKRIFK